jgi:hypothetical protein
VHKVTEDRSTGSAARSVPSDLGSGEIGALSARHAAEVLECLARVSDAEDLADGNALASQLADAVFAYVGARRDEGAPPERVVAEVKEMRNALAARVRMTWRAALVADELTTLLIEWCIAAYFE